MANVAAAWTMLTQSYPGPVPDWLTRALQMRNHADRTETDRALLTFAMSATVAFLVEMESVAGAVGGGDDDAAVRTAQSLAAKAKARVRRAQQRDALMQSMESNAMQIYALWCPEDAERLVQPEQQGGETTGGDGLL